MDSLAFEQLTRNTVREIATALRAKEQFHESPVFELALGLEEELYRRSNVSVGQSEFANAWEDSQASTLYQTLKSDFMTHLCAEHGAVWRRVESGQMSTKHVFEKCCPLLAQYPVLKKRKLEEDVGHEKKKKHKKDKKKKHKKQNQHDDDHHEHNLP